MDNRQSLMVRHRLMRAEIRSRMAASGKWTGLPGLLDEMHRLRVELRELAPSTATGGLGASVVARPRSR